MRLVRRGATRCTWLLTEMRNSQEGSGCQTLASPFRITQRKETSVYTVRNFKTKKALKEAVAAGQRVEYYQPGPFGGNEPREGKIYVEGPHYPEPHRWYAACEAKEGVIVKVR